jgi:DNA-binding XRE family transcriptional regulator
MKHPRSVKQKGKEGLLAMARQLATENSTTTSSTWEEVRAELDFTPEEEREIARRQAEQLAAVRAHRLAEVRKRHEMTQKQLAGILEISQERVSQIERTGLASAQMATIAAYVEALGGRLRVVADFGDEQLVLG